MLRHDHPTSTAWRHTPSASSPPPPHTCAHHQRAWEEEGEGLRSNTDQSTGKCAHLPLCCRNSAHELDSALIFISKGTLALGNTLFVWLLQNKKAKIWKLHQVCYGEFSVANSPIFGCWTTTTLTTIQYCEQPPAHRHLSFSCRSPMERYTNNVCGPSATTIIASEINYSHRVLVGLLPRAHTFLKGRC